MGYLLHGLEPALFESLFSLEDAPVGEPVLLLPFVHQDSRSPYRASGPIFVRRCRVDRA